MTNLNSRLRALEKAASLAALAPPCPGCGYTSSVTAAARTAIISASDGELCGECPECGRRLDPSGSPVDRLVVLGLAITHAPELPGED